MPSAWRHSRSSSPSSWVARTTKGQPEDLVIVARHVDDTVDKLKQIVSWIVLEVHDRGATWDDIGDAFGVSRQTVHERFGPNSRALRRGDQEDRVLDDDLR